MMRPRREADRHFARRVLRVLVTLLAWAPIAALIAAVAWWSPYPAEVAAAGAIAALGTVLYQRIKRRRFLAELERRAGAPRRQRRAAHRAGGRAVWRMTGGRLG